MKSYDENDYDLLFTEKPRQDIFDEDEEAAR
jgi:hypothetical protein